MLLKVIQYMRINCLSNCQKAFNYFFYKVAKYLVKKHILNGSGNECVWLRNNYVRTERLDWAHK